MSKALNLDFDFKDPGSRINLEIIRDNFLRIGCNWEDFTPIFTFSNMTINSKNVLNARFLDNVLEKIVHIHLVFELDIASSSADSAIKIELPVESSGYSDGDIVNIGYLFGTVFDLPKMSLSPDDSPQTMEIKASDNDVFETGIVTFYFNFSYGQ